MTTDLQLNSDEALAAAKLISGVGQDIQNIGNISFDDISQELPGSEAGKALTNASSVLHDRTKNLAQWPINAGKKITNIVNAIVHKDQSQAQHLPNSSGDNTGNQPRGQSTATSTSSPVSAPIDNAGRIAISAISYGGKGSFPGGEQAMRDAINHMLDLKGITDPVARKNWMDGLLTICEHESAMGSAQWLINTTDINATRLPGNAADGFPAGASRGPWQCIPETFAAYHQAGTSDNIYDPVASSAAAMNYIMSRYGVSADGSNLRTNVAQANPGTRQGY